MGEDDDDDQDQLEHAVHPQRPTTRSANRPPTPRRSPGRRRSRSGSSRRLDSCCRTPAPVGAPRRPRRSAPPRPKGRTGGAAARAGATGQTLMPARAGCTTLRVGRPICACRAPRLFDQEAVDADRGALGRLRLRARQPDLDRVHRVRQRRESNTSARYLVDDEYRLIVAFLSHRCTQWPCPTRSTSSRTPSHRCRGRRAGTLELRRCRSTSRGRRCRRTSRRPSSSRRVGSPASRPRCVSSYVVGPDRNASTYTQLFDEADAWCRGRSTSRCARHPRDRLGHNGACHWVDDRYRSSVSRFTPSRYTSALRRRWPCGHDGHVGARERKRRRGAGDAGLAVGAPAGRAAGVAVPELRDRDARLLDRQRRPHGPARRDERVAGQVLDPGAQRNGVRLTRNAAVSSA